MATVVIVDDHAGFRAMARALLLDGGFQVVGEAATGGQALTVVAELAPDVVLLDVRLPDVDGFTVCQMLRDAGSAARVVLCSIGTGADYGSRVRGCGAAGFVAKTALTAEAIRELCGA
ncbi:MAG TPA: response regulator transcription factor [Rugosimonospora sp.]|jgi:two-component system nitrate/nitrite response regulator NarL